MNPDYTDHDITVVIPELERLVKGADSDQTAEVFALALEKRASTALLAECARLYVTYAGEKQTPVGLPYVKLMLDAGYSREEAREVVFHLIATDDGEGTHQRHYQAFWQHGEAQLLFDYEHFVRLCMAMADLHPNDMLGSRDTIASRIGGIKRGPYGNYDDYVNAGMPDAMRVMARAAMHIDHLRNEAELDVVLEVTASARQIAAQRSGGRWLDMILKGFVFGKLGMSHETRGRLESAVYSRISRVIERGDYLEALRRYRWLLYGAHKGNGRDYYQLCEGVETIRRSMEQWGFQFLPVTMRQNPNSQAWEPQVEVQTGSGRVVLKHLRRGQRNEMLREGDEVIVHPSQWEKAQPVFSRPGMSIYSLELHPCAPPSVTSVMYVRRWGREQE